MSKTICLLAALSVMPAAGDDAKVPGQRISILEVIDVYGTCYEDHVRQPDDYVGFIARYQNDETMAITSYGFVTLIDWLKNSMDESTHPTVYHAPFLVEFINIEADTSGAHWTVHGVSSRGENEQGYDSTCEFDVIKRDKELDNPMDHP